MITSVEAFYTFKQFKSDVCLISFVDESAINHEKFVAKWALDWVTEKQQKKLTWILK